MKQRDLDKILFQIVADYKKSFGDSTGNLTTFRFNISAIDSNEEIRRVCVAAAPDPIQANKYLLRAFDHFVSEGYAKSRGENYELSKLGYEQGTKSIVGKAVDFLNSNPGILSLFALVVSLVALYVSYTKP